jgi:hypothetical protein
VTRLVRNGNGPVFTSTAPEWLERLLLRGALLARIIGPEDRECILFGDRVREAALNGRLRATFTHIPHEVAGGTKNAALRYSLASAMGMVTGATDYVFLWRPRPYEQPSDHPVRPPPVVWFGGCWMEFKRPTVAKTAAAPRRQGGALSDKQKLFRDWCIAQGVPHHVVTSARDGLDILASYGVYDMPRS